MKIATVALVLAFAALTTAQDSSDVTALTGLQSCIQASKANIPYVNGWGLGLSTGGASSAGRKMLQTAANCAAAAAISSAIPCTPTAATPTTPTTPGSPAGTTTTPSGVPTGTSSNPCGDSSNPVPWTGLLCTSGRVTSVVISQLGPNIFKGTCDVGTLGDLAGLSAATIVDFTAAGLSGTVPAAWGTGAWAATLSQLTLAKNPQITGAVPDISGLTALTSIDISSSGFSGPLPASFNSTTSPKLASFTAFGNNLSGALPTSLPMSLTTLGLGYNKFNGSLPAYTSTDLAYIQLNNNSLSGCLPSEWTTGLTNITNIDVSNNQLSGPIPASWQASGAFPTLQTISIVGNQLCGGLGQLGTPVGTVGQNNPSATRLVPSPGTLPACSGTDCAASAPVAGQAASFATLYFGPAPSPGPSLAPESAMSATSLPVLP